MAGSHDEIRVRLTALIGGRRDLNLRTALVHHDPSARHDASVRAAILTTVLVDCLALFPASTDEVKTP